MENSIASIRNSFSRYRSAILKYWLPLILVFFSVNAEAQQSCRPVKGLDIYLANGTGAGLNSDIMIPRLEVLQLYLGGLLGANGEIKSAFVSSSEFITKYTEEVSAKYFDVFGEAIPGAISDSLRYLMGRRAIQEGPEDIIANALVGATTFWLASDTAVGPNSKDLLRHLSLYESSLNADKQVLILGHSHGSVLANLAYQNLQLERPEDIGRIGYVNIGAITSCLPREDGLCYGQAGATAKENYHTFLNDETVNDLRNVIGTVLIGTDLQVDRPPDGTGHFFHEYFNVNSSTDRNPLIGKIVAAASALDDEICLPRDNTCTDLLVTGVGWNGSSYKGLDLRSYTNNSLAWIGCWKTPGWVWGCAPSSFYCTDGVDEIRFGTNESLGLETHMIVKLGSSLPPNLTYPDATFLENVENGHCGRHADTRWILNAPSSVANGGGFNSVQALCASLGYTYGEVVRETSQYVWCEPAHAKNGNGTSWSYIPTILPFDSNNPREWGKENAAGEFVDGGLEYRCWN